jgi:hypothetical protein
MAAKQAWNFYRRLIKAIPTPPKRTFGNQAAMSGGKCPAVPKPKDRRCKIK